MDILRVLSLNLKKKEVFPMEYEAMLIKSEWDANKKVSFFSRIGLILFFLIFSLHVTGFYITPISTFFPCAYYLIALFLFPTFLVDVLKWHSPFVKYLIMTSFLIITGIFFSIFTFHAILLFLYPSVFATIYLNKRLMIYTMISTIFCILISHYFSFYFQVIDVEPFKDFYTIFVFGASIRILEYLGFVIPLFTLAKKTSGLVYDICESIKKNTRLEEEKNSSAKRLKWKNERRLPVKFIIA